MMTLHMMATILKVTRCCTMHDLKHVKMRFQPVFMIHGPSSGQNSSVKRFASDERIDVLQSRSRDIYRRHYYTSASHIRALDRGQLHGSWTLRRPFNDMTYHDVADRSLEEILNMLTALETSDKISIDDVELSLSQGVLKLDLGSHGSWVINKQAPNKQLWWSSPVSGPKRYEYIDGTEKKSQATDELKIFEIMISSHRIEASQYWKSTRDGSSLIRRLRDEILEKTGIDIAL